jgi:N-acetyl-alpha-D-glucosaminyl L-malate synthase BshA
MKIGMICYPTFGGSGIVATELGMELAARGVETHFISYDTPARLDRFRENIFFHDVDIPRYPLFEFQLYTLALAGKIIDVVKYEKIDIIHAHYAIPHAVSAYLSKQILKDYNVKLITTLHGTDVTLVGMEPSFHPIIKYALEQSDGITAVSKYLADKTKSLFDLDKEIDTIHNFIDPGEYTRKPLCPCRCKLAPNGEKTLIHISNFRPVKRVLDTIRILEKVNEQVPTNLILIGDGPERNDAERLCRELNLCSRVKFLGKMTAFSDLLSAADLFLLPSQSESFGLAALEAMACGVPVIASNIGGIPELVTHGENGYMAEFGDVERMSRYALELLKNPKKWQAFSDKARSAAVEKFSADRIVDQYMALYNRLLG